MEANEQALAVGLRKFRLGRLDLGSSRGVGDRKRGLSNI